MVWSERGDPGGLVLEDNPIEVVLWGFQVAWSERGD